jgi:ribosomal protein L21
MGEATRLRFSRASAGTLQKHQGHRQNYTELKIESIVG